MLFAAELLDALTEEHDPHAALFDHFIRFLQDIEEGTSGPERGDILVRLILLQLVLLSDYVICPSCQTPLSVNKDEREQGWYRCPECDQVIQL